MGTSPAVMAGMAATLAAFALLAVSVCNGVSAVPAMGYSRPPIGLKNPCVRGGNEHACGDVVNLSELADGGASVEALQNASAVTGIGWDYPSYSAFVTTNKTAVRRKLAATSASESHGAEWSQLTWRFPPSARFVSRWLFVARSLLLCCRGTTCFSGFSRR